MYHGLKKKIRTNEKKNKRKKNRQKRTSMYIMD